MFSVYLEVYCVAENGDPEVEYKQIYKNMI